MTYKEHTQINIDNPEEIIDGVFIIGKVFFAYNSNILYDEDKGELSKLRTLYHRTLKSKKVHFYCIGATDYRGKSEDNLKLGNRRSNAVIKYLMELFRNYPLLHIANIQGRIDNRSIGENEAHQPRNEIKPSKQEMAEDRCVFIGANCIPNRVIVLPPIQLKASPIKYVDRVVRKYYSKHIFDKAYPPKPSSEKAVDYLNEEIAKKIKKRKSGVSGEFLGHEIFGNEEISRRQYYKTIDYFEINDIYIDFYPEFSFLVTGLITEITYVWGFPNEIITIRITRKKSNGELATKEFHTIPRNEQEQILAILP